MKLLLPFSLMTALIVALLMTSCGKVATVEPPCENEILTWYGDADGDGVGNSNNPYDLIPEDGCMVPAGFVQFSGDLDDTQSGITTISNRTKFLELLAGIQDRDISVLEYVSDNLIQHNPNIEDKKAGLEKFMLENPEDLEIDIKRVFTDQDGNIFIAHSIYGGGWNDGTPQVVFDIYRFDNGKMVEHWDNIADEVEEPDFFTQTNGPKTVNPSQVNMTSANRSLVVEMSSELLLDDNDDLYLNYFESMSEFEQHGVGIDPLIPRFKTLMEAAPEGEGIYDSREAVYAEGDFVLLLSEGPDIDGLSSGKFAYYDLFRLFNGRIWEHWEVKQEITNSPFHSNGKW